MAEGRSHSPAVKESTPSLQQETGWMQFSMLDMLTFVTLNLHMGGNCQHGLWCVKNMRHYKHPAQIQITNTAESVPLHQIAKVKRPAYFLHPKLWV